MAIYNTLENPVYIQIAKIYLAGRIFMLQDLLWRVPDFIHRVISQSFSARRINIFVLPEIQPFHRQAHLAVFGDIPGTEIPFLTKHPIKFWGGKGQVEFFR